MDVRLWSRTDDSRRIRRPLATFMSLAFPYRFSPDCPIFWVNFTGFFFLLFSLPVFVFSEKSRAFPRLPRILSYSVFTGISCLEIHYLSKKILDRGVAARNNFHSILEGPINFNPTCSSIVCRKLHANRVCLTRVLCVKRVGKCYVKEELGLQRDLCVFLNNNVFSYVKV